MEKECIDCGAIRENHMTQCMDCGETICVHCSFWRDRLCEECREDSNRKNK